MDRSHAQQFANHTLLRQAFAEPLLLTRGIAKGEAERVLREVWDRAGSELAPIARVPASALAATMERQFGLYTVVHVTPPAPRRSGDPAAIVIIGRGDGTSKLSAIGYYVLTLMLDGPYGTPRFTFASRDGQEEKALVTIEGPLPNPDWLTESAFALYEGRTPEPRDRQREVPALPAWYWWYAFDGAEALSRFIDAADDPVRFDAVRRAPLLLLPEIADAIEVLADPKHAKKLRELRPYLRRDPSMGPAWKALAERLANTTGGAPGAHTTHALDVVAEAREGGALSLAAAYELEAFVRCRLALIGIDPDENNLIAQKLALAAEEAAQPRLAHDGAAAAVDEDPLWKPLFLDETDLPHATPTAQEEANPASDPTFVQYGGLRAAHVTWSADEHSALAYVVDSRWVFCTAFGAQRFLQEPSTTAMLADGLPPLPAPQLGDDACTFGGESADGRRMQILVVRVGRVIARIQAAEGVHAAASRQILHAAVLHPIGLRAAQRCREGIAAYWLHVAKPTNAVPALLHSPGFDVARLIEKYPLLALPHLSRPVGWPLQWLVP